LAAYFWDRIHVLWGNEPVWVDIRDFISWVARHVPLERASGVADFLQDGFEPKVMGEALRSGEACAMAELPAERLPLAAEDQITHKTIANLIRMEAGRVKSVTPIAMELYGRSGELTLSGRIHGLPEDFDHSHFICFLEPEGRMPVSPARCEWKEETGDFIIDFSYMEDITWRLKAAVVIETA